MIRVTAEVENRLSTAMVRELEKNRADALENEAYFLCFIRGFARKKWPLRGSRFFQ